MRRPGRAWNGTWRSARHAVSSPMAGRPSGRLWTLGNRLRCRRISTAACIAASRGRFPGGAGYWGRSAPRWSCGGRPAPSPPALGRRGLPIAAAASLIVMAGIILVDRSTLVRPAPEKASVQLESLRPEQAESALEDRSEEDTSELQLLRH